LYWLLKLITHDFDVLSTHGERITKKSVNSQRGLRQSANVMLNGVKHLVTAQQRLYFFDQIL